MYRISMISIHALREEGDSPAGGGVCAQDNFYPRPPRGGRRNMGCSWACPADFYPRPPRGGRHAGRRGRSRRGRISIHALREEGDGARFCTTHQSMYFYPRPPRGGRPTRSVANVLTLVFLSTPSARRATKSPTACRAFWEFLSTPSARRATLHGPRDGLQHSISIHALREEGDAPAMRSRSTRTNFYPRPPRGGRPCASRPRPRRDCISIHALREEGDEPNRKGVSTMKIFLSTPSARRATTAPCRPYTVPCHFYPRPPRGGRPLWLSSGKAQKRFLSTPSARRATIPAQVSFRPRGHFYPRPPRGGRLFFPHNRVWRVRISIHALREEGDALVNQAAKGSRISIHALREEGDRMGCERVHRRTDFYPRPPRGGRPKPTRNDMHPTIFLSTPSARRATYAPCIFRPCRRFLSTPSARRATQLS